MPSSITLTVKNLAASTSFFLSTLQPLDYVYRGRVESTIGFGLKDSPPDFWVSQEQPGIPAGAAHVAFPAASQTKVQEFFIAALKAGGKPHGEPALRDQASGYFSAAVLDFDGNSIEAVYRQDLVDEGYGSRPSSMSSVSSAKSKSPTMASRASTARPAPSEVRSMAPSQASKAPSKAPTSASKSPTQVSRAPTSTSKAPTAAPSQTSRAPSQASRAPTSISRAQTYGPSQSGGEMMTVPPGNAVTHTTPTGEVVTTLVSEARGALSIAKEIVSHVRPALDSANSTPNLTKQTHRTSDPNSHKPSDTIVGTLLGVAAGAAIHYAYTKATEGDKKHDSEPARRPSIARTNTEPSFANGAARNYYYHEYGNQTPNHPYAIEAPSEYGRSQYEPSRVSSQRFITMQDNDDHLSDYAPSQAQRARRRSSFSGIDVRSFTSASRASQNPKSASRMLEGPPTSYRAPTAITQADTQVSGRSQSRSRSKSRISSAISHRRSNSVSGDSKASRRTSRRTSDEDLRSSTSKSQTPSRRQSRSRAPSSTVTSEATTVKPIKPHSKPPSRAPSRSSTTRRPESTPLPPSRAGTTISAASPPSDYHSTHSKANKTVIGKMLERERTGGKSELTKSVVGKIEDSERLDVSRREVEPSDSVSQAGSVRSSRSRR